MKLYRSISYTKQNQNDYGYHYYNYFLSKDSCLDYINKVIKREIKVLPLSKKDAKKLTCKNLERKMNYYNEVICHMCNKGKIEDGIIIFYNVEKVKK